MYNGSTEPASDEFPVIPTVDVRSFFPKERENEDGDESDHEAD